MSSACLLYRLILDGCNNRPQAPAIQASGKKALSYRELSRHLQSTALQFSRLGIRTGDRLAVVLRLASQVYGIKFKIKFHLDNLQDKNILEILKYTGLLAQRLTTRWWYTAVGVRAIDRYERKGQVKEARRLLLHAYNLEHYDGQVTLFSATHRPSYMNWDPKDQWTNIFTGPFEIVPIPGDHMSILEPPNVTILIEKITDTLHGY